MPRGRPSLFEEEVTRSVDEASTGPAGGCIPGEAGAAVRQGRGPQAGVTGLVEAMAFPDAIQTRWGTVIFGEVVPVMGVFEAPDGLVILCLVACERQLSNPWSEHGAPGPSSGSWS